MGIASPGGEGRGTMRESPEGVSVKKDYKCDVVFQVGEKTKGENALYHWEQRCTLPGAEGERRGGGRASGRWGGRSWNDTQFSGQKYKGGI